MAEYSKNEFDIMKKQAAQRVMEMYKGAGGKMPPYPDFISVPKAQETEKEPQKIEREVKKEIQKGQNNTQFLRYFNFSELMKNREGLLLIGLILLLSSEGTDELLILALAYILL